MFYGWVIVGLAFVANFVVMGAWIQIFPVFLLPLSEEFSIGRAQAALPPAAIMVCGVFAGPVIGRAVAQYPIRNAMLVGAAVMSAGLFAASIATHYWQILLAYGIGGAISLSSLGIISCNSIIVNWFERRRALALGIAMIGMSISGAVQIPLAAWAVEAWGWRATYQAFAIAPLLLMPLIAWLAVTRPADLGLEPDGDVPAPASEIDGADESFADMPPPASLGPDSTRTLFASPTLWMIAAACGLVFFASQGLMNHGLAFAVERGVEPIRAAAMLSAISIGAAFGKLLFGWLAGRLGERGAFGVALAGQFIALLGFTFQSGYVPLVSAAALYGLGLGGITPLQAALLARSFGDRNFAPVMGLIGPLTIPFQIIGAPLTGWIFDARGSYDLALAFFMGSLICSGVVIWILHLREASDPSAQVEHDAHPA